MVVLLLVYCIYVSVDGLILWSICQCICPSRPGDRVLTMLKSDFRNYDSCERLSMVGPPIRRDNARALVSGLSTVQTEEP